MATFRETCAIPSRKYASEPGMAIPNLSEKLQFFWSHASVFALERKLKKLNFQSFLPLRNTLVAAFNEMCAPTSRKYVAEKGMVMPN